MKKAVRYSISGALAVLFCLGMSLLYGHMRRDQAELVCSGLQIGFADTLRFISEDDIREYLDTRYGAYVGERLDSMQLARIEDLMQQRSAVMRCEAWTTDDGILHLDITQRAPALRFQSDGAGFYVDSQGFIFPLHDSFTVHVATVEGAIPIDVPAGYKGEAPTEAERKWIAGVLAMNNFISSSRTWHSSVTHIQVRPGGDLLLKLDTRPEQFLIGQPEDIPDKLARIGRYLTLIAPYKAEGYYKTVNVKYKQQIICRQKDT